MQTAAIGQVLRTDFQQGIKRSCTDQIRNFCEESKIFLATRKVSIIIGSQNEQKIAAVTKAVQKWAMSIAKNIDLSIVSYEADSEINPQPVGLWEIKEGASNRLWKIRDKLHHERDSLVIYIALENGIMEEKQMHIHNSGIFESRENHTWVDRCLVKVLIKFGYKEWYGDALSVGVTVPKECVEKAEKSEWKKTAGSFIAEQYTCYAGDWHKKIGGISREEIMENAIETALGMGNRFCYAIE